MRASLVGLRHGTGHRRPASRQPKRLGRDLDPELVLRDFRDVVDELQRVFVPLAAGLPAEVIEQLRRVALRDRFWLMRGFKPKPRAHLLTFGLSRPGRTTRWTK